MNFYINTQHINNVDSLNDIFLEFNKDTSDSIHKYLFDRPQFFVKDLDKLYIGNVTNLDKELTSNFKFANGLYFTSIYTICFNKSINDVLNLDIILSLLDKKYQINKSNNSNKYSMLTYEEYPISYVIDYSDENFSRYVILYSTLDMINYFFFPDKYVNYLKDFSNYMENNFYELIISYISANSIDYKVI